MTRQRDRILPEDVGEKLDALNDMHLMHRTFSYALSRIEERRVRSAYEDKPKSLMILGPTGGGKTTLAETVMMQHKHRQIRTDGILKRPIVYCCVPSPASAKSLGQVLLQTLIPGLRATGTATELRESIVKNVQTMGVELIILDEVQHLSEAKGDSTIRKAADWLKLLSDASKIPMLLLGIETSRNLLTYNEQLRRRVPEVIELSPYTPGYDDDVEAFREVLVNIDEKLPFDKRSNLADPQIAKGLMKVSDGMIGLLVEFVREAAIIAISLEHNKILKSDLHEAFVRTIQSSKPNLKSPFQRNYSDAA